MRMALAGLAAALLGNAAPMALRRGSDIHLAFGPTSEAEATIKLDRGESADIAVVQRGIDVVVQLMSPDGKMIDEVDSPNGRNGDEPISIHAAASGNYRLTVRAISPNEPTAFVDIKVRAIRTIAETREVRREQAQLRQAAASWLRRNDVALPTIGALASGAALQPFDSLAQNAQVIGLGEATHGSREFGDVRLALVKRLVQRHGYRLIAVEDSSARWRALAPYVEGAAAAPALPTQWGWIGRRSRKDLLDWARSWNLGHPADQVRIVGTDPQDNPFWRTTLPALLARAYGEPLLKEWQAHEAEIAAADEQTQVFGDSSIAVPTRNFLVDLLARVTTDAPLLKRRLGPDYAPLLETVSELAAFADFNSGGGTLSKSRDWYMALRLLHAMDGSASKAIYWGHNAHVAVTGPSTAGALLRKALGCGYRAIATTFGGGDFLAQVPNDPGDRLSVTTVPTAQEGSVEAILADVRPGVHMAAWECGPGGDKGPPLLRDARPMRWVGGLYAPQSIASASYRPYRLTEAFDAVIYFPRVSAEADPGGRQSIPPRKP